MFLTQTDYKSLVDSDDLTVYQDSDVTQREQAEDTAQEIISGYIRSRYNVTAIFTATGTARNKVLIMLMVDIVLYNLSAAIPGRIISDSRQKRFDDAMKTLKDIQRGNVDLGLPLIDTEDSGSPIRWGSNTKQNNDW